MRRPLLAVTSLLAIAVALFSASSTQAQPHGRRAQTGVNGTWTYAGSPAEGDMIVRQAVEPVVSMMQPDIQQIARERIAESTWLPTQIRIGARGSRVQVALSGAERRNFSSAQGSVIQVPMRHGYAQLTQSIRPDGSVQQDFTAIDGTQQNIYFLNSDGSMIVDVTLRSQQLPGEIHFQLMYRRGGH